MEDGDPVAQDAVIRHHALPSPDPLFFATPPKLDHTTTKELVAHNAELSSYDRTRAIARSTCAMVR